MHAGVFIRMPMNSVVNHFGVKTKKFLRTLFVLEVSMKQKLFLGSYKIYPFKHAISKFEISGVKNCRFCERSKLGYFALKNDIRIARPKCHMTITADVILVPRIAIHHGGREKRIFLHRCSLMCMRSCSFQNR